MTSTESGVGRFLTIADTADVLNISLESAYDLVRSGELAAIRVGSRGPWRVERIVLENFIEALYEESRRMSLWQRSDPTLLPDLGDDFGAEPSNGRAARGGAIISPIHRRISTN